MLNPTCKKLHKVQRIILLWYWERRFRVVQAIIVALQGFKLCNQDIMNSR